MGDHDTLQILLLPIDLSAQRLSDRTIYVCVCVSTPNPYLFFISRNKFRSVLCYYASLFLILI
jgi:hypothetical protein